MAGVAGARRAANQIAMSTRGDTAGRERTLEPGLNTNIESPDTLSVISVIVN